MGISQGRTAVNPPPRRRYRAVQARLSRDGIPKNFQASLPRLPRNSDYEYIAVLFAVFPDENSATIESERIPRRDSNENSGEWNLTWFLLERDVGGGGCKKVGGISIFPDIEYFGFPENRREKAVLIN